MYLSKLIESFEVCVKFHKEKFFFSNCTETQFISSMLPHISISIFLQFAVPVFAWHQRMILFYDSYGFSFFQLRSCDTASKRTPITLRTSLIWHPSFFSVFTIDIRFLLKSIFHIYLYTFASNKKTKQKRRNLFIYGSRKKCDQIKQKPWLYTVLIIPKLNWHSINDSSWNLFYYIVNSAMK